MLFIGNTNVLGGTQGYETKCNCPMRLGNKRRYVWFECNTQEYLDSWIANEINWRRIGAPIMTARTYNAVSFTQQAIDAGIQLMSGFKTSNAIVDDIYSAAGWAEIASVARQVAELTGKPVVLENEGTMTDNYNDGLEYIDEDALAAVISAQDWPDIWFYYGIAGSGEVMINLTTAFTKAVQRGITGVRFVETNSAAYLYSPANTTQQANLQANLDINPNPISITYEDDTNYNFWLLADTPVAVATAYSQDVIIYPGFAGLETEYAAIQQSLGVLTESKSQSAVSVAFTGTRYDGDELPYFDNVPVIDESNILHIYPEYASSFKYTEDISQTSKWTTNNSPTITGVDGFQGTIADGMLYQTKVTVEGENYTMSFDAKLTNAGDRGTGFWFLHYYCGVNRTEMPELTGEWKRYQITVPGRTGGGSGLFGIQDKNTDGFVSIQVRKFQVADGPAMPYVKVDDLTTTTPANNASATTGVKMALADIPDFAGLLSDSEGEISVTWIPYFDSDDVSGLVNIVSLNDAVSDLLYYDADAEQLKTTDGTNTANVALSVTNGTSYFIKISWKDNELWISANGVTGAKVAFAGAFTVGTDLSFGWESPVWQGLKTFQAGVDNLIPQLLIGGGVLAGAAYI